MEYKVKKKGRPCVINEVYDDIKRLNKKEYIIVYNEEWKLKTPPNGARLRAKLGKRYKVETLDTVEILGWKITRL
jgi:hypothetical protein